MHRVTMNNTIVYVVGVRMFDIHYRPPLTRLFLSRRCLRVRSALFARVRIALFIVVCLMVVFISHPHPVRDTIGRIQYTVKNNQCFITMCGA